MIQVRVRLYAQLRRYRPGLGIGEPLACQVAEQTTVGTLTSEILQLPENEIAITLVNGLRRDRDFVLQDGDQVSFWSPIAGG